MVLRNIYRERSRIFVGWLMYEEEKSSWRGSCREMSKHACTHGSFVECPDPPSTSTGKAGSHWKSCQIETTQIDTQSLFMLAYIDSFCWTPRYEFFGIIFIELH